MNKVDLIAAIAARTGASKVATEAQVKLVLDIMCDALARGERLQLAGFGGFTVNQRPERTGRNPRTGSPLLIPASRSVKFVPCKRLRDQLRTRR